MASSSSSSHATAASSSRSYKYNVFLSFRGEDTRKTFVDHLYSTLGHHLITTYKDDEALPRGEYIGSSLFKAIEESQIAVVVFSKNYADSSWCLKELTHIMKCEKEELIVMPVFYDVTPSDVRNQNGDFGKAFAKQEVENNSEAQLWRSALVSACSISGWEIKQIANGHESKVIKKIAEAILDKLVPINAYVVEDYVGMKSRMQEFIAQLEIGSEGVRMVGIWGLGGSGKTTLATSVYMEICHQYHGHCILENVREESTRVGLYKLQEKMLSDILKINLPVKSVTEGNHLIKELLHRKKVLIVLDDVDDSEQLNALARSHSCFGSGSIIIITTRDKHLLNTHKVVIYPVKLLSDDESIELFNRHAYNEEDPIEDYETLSLSVISYAARLPLALRVLGCFLCDKEKKEWLSALDKLKDIPDTKILDKLKISYDGLDTLYKELFLDIACFWRGSIKGEAMEILDAFGLHPEIGIKVLIQKALITINTRSGEIDMHDLIQEMGRYIVKEKHPYNPEKHSRVWKYQDTRNMCFEDAPMKNDKIKAISYICHEQDHDHASKFYKFVSNMTEVRYLKVGMCDPMYVEGPITLSKELRCVDWYGYPARCPFVDNFPMKLVVLKLGDSLQEELWNGCKCVPYLKVLVLRDMEKLLSTPNFDGLPSLQRFLLDSCPELKEIHPSFGNHTSLKYVNIIRCEKLQMLPTIAQMKNLESLEITGCAEILEFPEIQANMNSLLNLSLVNMNIKVLPSAIGERCVNLVSLYLYGLDKLKSIEFNFDALKSLKEFTLGGSIQLEKTRLPLFHQFLHNVQKLELGTECFFKEVEIPPHIVDLSDNDVSPAQVNPLKRTPITLHGYGGRFVPRFELSDFPSSLTKLDASKWFCEALLKLKININDDERPLVSGHNIIMAIEDRYMHLRLTGVEVAKRFTPRMLKGSKGTLKLPENWFNDFSGFLMCAIFSNDHTSNSASISMYEEISGMDSQHDAFWKETDSDSLNKYTWVSYVSFASLRQTAWWNQTHKAILFDVGDICCGFGVRLIEKKSRIGLTKTSSGYRHYFKIEDDSASALKISFKFL